MEGREEGGREGERKRKREFVCAVCVRGNWHPKP